MAYFDTIRELRTDTPNPEKLQKYMNNLGWVGIGIFVWNAFFLFSDFIPQKPEEFKPPYMFICIGLILIAGILCFISAYGIKHKADWAIKTGQTAFIIFIIILAIFGFFIATNMGINKMPFPLTVIVLIFSVLVVGQFILPAYFGIGYLGRLKFSTENNLDAPHKIRYAQSESQYKEDLLPIGIFGTSLFLIIGFLALFFIMRKLISVSGAGLFIFLLFFMLFFAPTMYNNFPSKFEKSRNILSSYTGGGSIFMFWGSWPFFRLLIYRDGIEIRVMFHRFFIPYDKMNGVPQKIGFFSFGILIKSDITGVPSNICFYPFSSNRVLQSINEARCNIGIHPKGTKYDINS